MEWIISGYVSISNIIGYPPSVAVDGTPQTDFMDAWSNVVEVGAVRSVDLISGGIANDTDAGVTYTVTDLVGNGDGDGDVEEVELPYVATSLSDILQR